MKRIALIIVLVSVMSGGSALDGVAQSPIQEETPSRRPPNRESQPIGAQTISGERERNPDVQRPPTSMNPPNGNRPFRTDRPSGAAPPPRIVRYAYRISDADDWEYRGSQAMRVQNGRVDFTLSAPPGKSCVHVVRLYGGPLAAPGEFMPNTPNTPEPRRRPLNEPLGMD